MHVISKPSSAASPDIPCLGMLWVLMSRCSWIALGALDKSQLQTTIKPSYLCGSITITLVTTKMVIHQSPPGHDDLVFAGSFHYIGAQKAA